MCNSCTAADPSDWKLVQARLRSIIERPATQLTRPLGPLHRSTLIANAEGDQLLDHLRSEFDSADHVDLLCALSSRLILASAHLRTGRYRNLTR